MVGLGCPRFAASGAVIGGLALASAFACGGTTVISDGGAGGEGAAGSGGAGLGCAVPTTPLGRICVRGDQVANGELIADGSPLRVEISPAGCFSSSCTNVAGGDCDLGDVGPTIDVAGAFCLEPTNELGCTNDCLDVVLACTGGALTSGEYLLRGPSGLELPFAVPSNVPDGGLCVGSTL